MYKGREIGKYYVLKRACNRNELMHSVYIIAIGEILTFICFIHGSHRKLKFPTGYYYCYLDWSD